jgi:hypothetical protein
MLNEIDYVYLAAVGILSPVAFLSSGLVAMAAMIALLCVWGLRTWFDNLVEQYR